MMLPLRSLVLLAALATGGTSAQLGSAPPNDSCATPTWIGGSGFYSFDNQLCSTGSEGQSEALCLSAGSTVMHRDSWFTWTSMRAGTVEISTCDTVLGGTDTRIAIYEGTGCPVAPAIACNDDAGSGCPAQPRSTTVSFTAVCGQSYTAQIACSSAAEALYGSFTLTELGPTYCGPAATPFCFGDGSGAACPCGNTGATGNGCASSTNPNGGNLTSSGGASISNDTLTLLGSGMPDDSSALYFQASSSSPGGQGTVFGDGIRCGIGVMIRLGTKTNVGGASQYPDVGDAPVSVRGSNAMADSRVYQVWYRNSAAFCTPAVFNLTNGAHLVWSP